MPLPAIIAFAAAAVGALLGAASFVRRSARLSNALFGAGMLTLAAELFFVGLGALHSHPAAFVTDQRNRLLAMSFLPACWVAFAATYARARSGGFKGLLARFKFLAAPLLLPPVLAIAYYENLAVLVVEANSPISSSLRVHLGWSGFLTHCFLILGCIGTIAGLERTYRASVGALRWKIKFMVYGLAALLATRFFTSCQALLQGEIQLGMNSVDAVAVLIGAALIARSLLRNGSFEIDLYPSKAVLSNSFTIGIAGIYLIVVGLLAKVMQWLQGDSGIVLKAIIILSGLVGLGLILQSDRFQQWVRSFVSRHFQRPLFDYQTVWLKVTEITSRSDDPQKLCQAAAGLLTRLFEVKLANVWLADSDQSFVLKASASHSLANSEIVPRFASEALLARFSESDQPIDLDENPPDWIEALRESNPSAFRDGGHRLCLPLVNQNDVVGAIVVGDRNHRVRFNQQEMDTLRCIVAHFASSLLSSKLSRQRAQTKEIEAFQTMAAFFVHDLKNAASTLNLMLRNMPQHWDNPEFREDALRGIGSANARITQLIERLGTVRNELNPRMERIDLAELAHQAVNQWARPDRIKLKLRVEAEAWIEGDPAKLRSVLLNLLINASEAIDGDGVVELIVERRGGSIAVSVKDTGSGMSPEFLRDSLFRPFRTTKKGGIGIGMFQSKAIMEAHGASIHAESSLGSGSRFTLLIPASPAPKGKACQEPSHPQAKLASAAPIPAP